MCVPYPQQFDAVFNLFTSFGYFEEEEDILLHIDIGHLSEDINQDNSNNVGFGADTGTAARTWTIHAVRYSAGVVTAGGNSAA